MRNVDHVPPVQDSLQEKSASRRQVMRTAPAVVAAMLLGGSQAPRVDGYQPHVSASPEGSEQTHARPKRSRQTPEAGRPGPRRPVSTLRQYRAVVPGPAFPADAVALTIDDGPHPLWTPKILKLLARHHVPACFFMIGNQVLGHEGNARDVVRDGHQIANHTWSHPTHMARKSGTRVHEEIERAQDKIYSTTDHTPTLFRSPGGDWSPTVLHTAAQAGMVALDWSNDPRDWARPGTAVIRRRLLAARPGQILLCHDGGGDRSQTYTALKTVLPALIARGYHFVALNGRN